MSDIITTDSLYNNQFTQNSTYKELLIFRSRWDANNQPAQGTGASINNEAKLFWVKTIKDYPYVEISHGKPNINTNTVIEKVNDSANYETKVKAESALKFGETIKVPNLEIADTGHIVGAKEQQLTLPTIQTTYPITITNSNSHAVIIKHEPYDANLPSNATVLTPTYSSISAGFGKEININAPKFDKWGHYRTLSAQTVTMPTIKSDSSPISVSFTANNTIATISHNTATAVLPKFEKANTTNLSHVHTSYLGEINILSVAETDGYGHSKQKIDLPFQINHPEPYTEVIEVESYLTPTTTVQTVTTKSPTSKTKLDFWFDYPVGLNYLPISPGSSAGIDLQLTNYNYTIPSVVSDLKPITIKIDDTQFSNGNWTFAPKEGILEQIGSNTYTLAITSLPTIGGTKVLGTFTIMAQSSFNSGTLYINNSTAVGNIAKLTIKASNSTIEIPNGIQIWDSNKVLCLPNLRITEEGHVQKVGETYIQLGEIGSNSGSNSNPGSDNPSDPTNPNPIIVDGMKIQLKVAVDQNDFGASLAKTLTFDAKGAQFEVVHKDGHIPQNPVEIWGQNSSSELQLTNKYSNFSIAYIHKPNKADAFKINNTQYYWAEPNLDNPTWEEYLISDEDLNSGNTIILYVHIPVTTVAPQQQDLVPIKIAAQLEGVINYLEELRFQLYSDQSPSSAPLSTKYKTINQIVNGEATQSVVSLNSIPETIGEGDNARTYYTSGLIYIDRNELFSSNSDLTVKAYIKPSGDIAHWRFTSVTINSKRPLPNNLSDSNPQYYYFTAKAQAVPSTTNPIRTTSSQSTTNTQVEDRLSTLEQSMLQLTNISDLKSVNNMESRLKLLEGQLAPVDYDTETEQMAAKNRLEEIETKVEETKAATEYANVDDKSISIEKSYKTLLLYYTGLVDFIADYLYKQTTTSTENVEAFRATYQLPLLKGESLIPTGTIPSFSPPVNDGGN